MFIFTSLMALAATAVDDYMIVVTGHLFNGLFSRTTWLSGHQKSKTILDFNEARSDGIGVSRLPVLDCRTTFHPGFGGRDSPSILSDISENTSFWQLKRLVTLSTYRHYSNNCIYLSIYLSMGWQWHQLDHLQIICTSLQTDNHASTSSLI